MKYVWLYEDAGRVIEVFFGLCFDLVFSPLSALYRSRALVPMLLPTNLEHLRSPILSNEIR